MDVSFPASSGGGSDSTPLRRTVNTFIFYDLETCDRVGTSGAGGQPRIIDIALLPIDRRILSSCNSGSIHDILRNSQKRAFQSLINPRIPVVEHITGLDSFDLCDAPIFDSTIAQRIMHFIINSGSPPWALVAHNGNKFDHRILISHLQPVWISKFKMSPNDLLCIDSLPFLRYIDKFSCGKSPILQRYRPDLANTSFDSFSTAELADMQSPHLYRVANGTSTPKPTDNDEPHYPPSKVCRRLQFDDAEPRALNSRSETQASSEHDSSAEIVQVEQIAGSDDSSVADSPRGDAASNNSNSLDSTDGVRLDAVSTPVEVGPSGPPQTPWAPKAKRSRMQSDGVGLQDQSRVRRRLDFEVEPPLPPRWAQLHPKRVVLTPKRRQLSYKLQDVCLRTLDRIDPDDSEWKKNLHRAMADALYLAEVMLQEYPVEFAQWSDRHALPYAWYKPKWLWPDAPTPT